MTRTVRSPVGRPVLKGRQPVSALWLPAAWFDDASRRQRIIGLWRVGATVTRFAQGDVLKYQAPVDLDCSRVDVWPLRLHGATLASAPLHAREVASLPPADLWIVVGSDVLSLRWSDGVPTDPAAWIDAGQAALHETIDWRPPRRTVDAVIAEARPLRDVLGDKIPPASAEQAAFLERLRERGAANARRAQAASDAAPGGRGRGEGVMGADLLVPLAVLAVGLVGAWLREAPESAAEARQGMDGLWMVCAIVFLVGLLLWKLRSAWRRAAPRFDASVGAAVQPAPGPAGGSEAPPGQPLPARRSVLSPQRWREWVARLAVASRLSKVLGRQQARYLQRMLDMFESGDLARALRHAVPLGGPHGQSLGQALGAPSARKDLSLAGASSRAGSTDIHVGDEFQEYLRKLYRRTFEQLDRQQRIDEAVFVLAELLNARQEALDYLEKHRRFAQAAELALAWDMPAEVIVRLHCLAGDWRRAVAVAHRDGVFASAVLQLETKWPDAANRLREQWGRTLAQQGHWLAAVDAVWPVAALRPLATEWMLTAEQAGGLLAARALVRRAVLLPDTLAQCEARLAVLRDDPGLHAERAAVAEALLVAKDRSEGLRGLAALIAASVMVDVARRKEGPDKRTFQALLDLGGDRFAQADLPSTPWPAVTKKALHERTEPLRLQAPEPGEHAVLDAVRLEGGGLLLAWGEAGVVLLDPAGRRVHRFATPAQKLVMSPSGQQALALVRRESLWRVSRLDLARRQAIDLGMLAATHVASTFDGLAWTVAEGSRVQVLDTSAALDQVLWQVTDLPGTVVALDASDDGELVLVDTPSHLELWGYALPRRRLYRRDTVPVCAPQAQRLLSGTRGVVDVSVVSEAPSPLTLHWESGHRRVHHDAGHPAQGPVALAAGGDLLLVCAADGARQSVQCVHLQDGRLCAQVAWPAGVTIGARWCGGTWVLFDDQGRVLVL